MKRTFLAGAIFAVLFSPAFGDGLILKDGRKVIGRVVEKPDGYEVTVEGQVMGFPKEQVDRWIKSPKDILGEADKWVNDAKTIYAEAVEMKDDRAAETKFKEALPKVTAARERYAEARDFFPDGYPELDKQLVNIMKLMRLVRERIGSQIASGPAVVRPKEEPPPAPKVASKPVAPEPPQPPPVPAGSLREALTVLADPALRGDAGKREGARALFKEAWQKGGALAEAAAAGYLFLSRDDEEWGLVADVVTVKAGAAETTYRGRLVQKSETLSSLQLPDRKELRIRKAADGTHVTPPGGSEFKAVDVKVVPDQKSEGFQALQGAFASLPAEKLEQLSAPEVTAGVLQLVKKAKELRQKGTDPSAEALKLLAFGLASALIAQGGGKPLPQLDPAFKELGFEKSEYGAVWGEKAGLAVDDYQKWMTSGEFELAVVQFQSEYRSVADVSAQYALGLLMLMKALRDNRYYARAASQFEVSARNMGGSAREHFLALAKSIRTAAPCQACAGTHAINCSACKGKAKVTLECGGCGGSGAVNTFNGVKRCVRCNGGGYFRNVDCPKCKASGKVVCKARDCTKQTPRPTFESFADAYACPVCRNKGSVFKHVALPCPECAGIGLILQPKSDPAKLLK